VNIDDIPMSASFPSVGPIKISAPQRKSWLKIRGRHLGCTKKQLRTAMYLLLDEALPHIKCELIEKRGNYMCDRCDDCMMEQLIRRAKDGELPKKYRQTKEAPQ
jgi:hypothetical protein